MFIDSFIDTIHSSLIVDTKMLFWRSEIHVAAPCHRVNQSAWIYAHLVEFSPGRKHVLNRIRIKFFFLLSSIPAEFHSSIFNQFSVSAGINCIYFIALLVTKRRIFIKAIEIFLCLRGNIIQRLFFRLTQRCLNSSLFLFALAVEIVAASSQRSVAATDSQAAYTTYGSLLQRFIAPLYRIYYAEQTLFTLRIFVGRLLHTFFPSVLQTFAGNIAQDRYKAFLCQFLASSLLCLF